jgi:hypothetical protein
MLTSTTPDYRPQLGGTTSALRWSVIAVKLSRRGGIKMSFFDVLSEVQKYFEDVSAGIDIFLIWYIRILLKI